MPKLPTRPYKGTRDFLPAEMSVRTQIFETMFRTVERFGFRRYDGPVLEAAEIYEAKSGEEIANQQLYRLTDKGGRQVALRPEMTPSVARMIAGNEHEVPFPARWYSHVNCHRYERPQRGRVREHWQLNVDIFGSEDLEAEVEIFDVVAALLAGLGATPEMYVLRVNDRVLVEGALSHYVGVPPDKLVDVGMVIDRWEKVDADARAKTLGELGLSTEQITRLDALTQMELQDYCKAAGEEAAGRSRLAHVLSNQLSEAPLQFDPLIMRAFNYYTSTVFEVFDISPENRRSIFGGGRYDDLASLFTTRKIPGIGFGMGDVTTWNFLDQHGLLPQADLGPDIFVFGTSPECHGVARTIARALRAAGDRASLSFESLGIRAGLKQANRFEADYAVIVADTELAAGQVILKNLQDGQQTLVDKDAVPAALQAAQAQSAGATAD